MFESTFVPEKPERSGTIALALILQTVAVAGFVIGPLLSVAVIDTNRAVTIVSPMRNLPKPRQPDASEPRETQSAVRSAFRVALLPAISRAFEAPRVITALAPGDPPVSSGGDSTRHCARCPWRHSGRRRGRRSNSETSEIGKPEDRASH